MGFSLPSPATLQLCMAMASYSVQNPECLYGSSPLPVQASDFPDNVCLDLPGQSLSAPVMALASGATISNSPKAWSACGILLILLLLQPVRHTRSEESLHSSASSLSHMCFVKAHREELWMSVDSPCVWGSQEGFTDMPAYTPVFSKVYLLSSSLEDSSVLILLTLHQ